MKKSVLFIYILLIITYSGYAQISDTLKGYPLDTAHWTIGGNATVVDSTVVLAPATTAQSGYAYYDSAVNLTLCAQFTVDFDFQIIADPSSTVADGIAFWYLSNPPTGLTTGSTIGLPDYPDGLMMILDTYDNVGLPDLNPKEELFYYDSTVAAYTEGDTTGQLAPVVDTQSFITDGSWHHCKITYFAGHINVYFNYSTVASLSGYKSISLKGYFGFSSSTGAAYSTQSIKNVIINAAGALSPPIVTTPLIYCQYALDSPLTAMGASIKWYPTATSLDSFPVTPVPNTSDTGTTVFYVRQGTGVCESAPDSIKVIVSPRPDPPVITGDTIYCSGESFVPLSVTGSSVLWYTAVTGGIGTTTPPFVNTSVDGGSIFYASQTVSGCESHRDSIKIAVLPTPPAPIVTGDSVYCQFTTFIPFSVTGSNIIWYTSPTGGTGTDSAPSVNTSLATTYNYYVAQRDSVCESPRRHVPVKINAKPAPPTLTSPVICQYLLCPPLSATGGSGSTLTWYGPGLPVSGSLLAPGPPSAVPGIDSYYVTQTILGCVSDSALDGVRTLPQPPKPLTTDTSYCQFSKAPPLTAIGSALKWYIYGSRIDSTPVPPTNFPGDMTWNVTQSITTLGVTCESKDTNLTVTTLYLPNFNITPSSSFVCHLDSINLSYTSSGPSLMAPTYTWTLPHGAKVVDGTDTTMSSIVVQFDSVDQNNYVYLTASDYSGRCSSADTIRINVVATPSATAYSKPDICQGDTTMLSISYESTGAAEFTWKIDGTKLTASNNVNIIASNSNSGGPFKISWVDSGIHVIQLNTFTKEGCPSLPSYDTVDVHAIPDAAFTYTARNGTFCLDDSILFAASANNYGYSYLWSPDRFFNNIDKPAEWGKLDENKSIVTLTVTDAFGCSSVSQQELDPGSCCTVTFPNAFAPNGTNRHFRPLFNGYHLFHDFRIANRWGQTVFESTGSNVEWDGNYNGVPQDMGVYYYYIKFDCGGNTIEQSGDVTLVR